MNHITSENGADKLRPADIFRQGIEHIFKVFQPLGYKVLKSNTIKKRGEPFTYEIHFWGSRYNYINRREGSGSVKMEVFCNVILNREIVFQLCFTSPMNHVRQFELLTPDLKLDEKATGFLARAIEEHFLPVVEGFERNLPEQLLKMGLVREAQAKDYSWMFTMKRDLAVFAGQKELLALFDANCQEYDQLDQVLRRSLREYYAFARPKADFGWCQGQRREELLDLMGRTYQVLKAGGGDMERLDAKYCLVKESLPADPVDMAISIFWFCAEIASFSSRWETAPELVREVERFHHSLFTNR